MLHHRRVTLTVYFEHIIPPKPRILHYSHKEWKKMRWKQCNTEKFRQKQKKFRKFHPKTEAQFRKTKIINSKKKKKKKKRRKKKWARTDVKAHWADAGQAVSAHKLWWCRCAPFSPERAQPGPIPTARPGPNPEALPRFRVSCANLREVKLCFVFRFRQFKGTLYHNVQHLGVVLVVRLRWSIKSWAPMLYFRHLVDVICSKCHCDTFSGLCPFSSLMLRHID